MQIDALSSLPPDAGEGEAAEAPARSFFALLASAVERPARDGRPVRGAETQATPLDDELLLAERLTSESVSRSPAEGVPAEGASSPLFRPLRTLASIPPAHLVPSGDGGDRVPSTETPVNPPVDAVPSDKAPTSAHGVRADTTRSAPRADILAGSTPEVRTDATHEAVRTHSASIPAPRGVTSESSGVIADRGAISAGPPDEISRDPSSASGEHREERAQREVEGRIASREIGDPVAGTRLTSDRPPGSVAEMSLASPVAAPPSPLATGATTGIAALEWAPPAPSAERSLARINERVEWLARRGGGSARIALDPPHLGEVEVRVRTVGDEVQVRLLSALPATQGALEMGREWLIDQLAARDFQSISVEFGSRGDRPSDERAALDRDTHDTGTPPRDEQSATAPPSQKAPDSGELVTPHSTTRIDLRI